MAMANQLTGVKAMRTSAGRISGLPDCSSNLCFVPTNYVVQTCVLSKRWKDLWHSIPTLDFDQTEFLVPNGSNQNIEGPINFSNFIYTVLLLRDYSNLPKLRHSWGHIKDDLSRINLWIIAAARRNVESLDLEIINVDSFELTRLHICNSLRELKLSFNYAIANPLTIACISSLQDLHLEHVTFVDNDQTNTLFSSALPVLKTLILDDCDFRNHNSNRTLTVLVTAKYHPGRYRGPYLKAEELGSNNSLPHLKLVRIQNFGGHENEVKFVQFLLKSAVVLEKMIIVAGTSSEAVSMAKKEVMKTGERLLTSPRASASVGILFM
ncbi:hypothetical protein IFM89_034667 [Coptis chinensis]|uniref:FBD domain-containing protein n=1 Tax=Coptis chinensis TaxID=261450 RepID=A0A835HS98_9MAGN|nr:hypothetical protein IFM89_034667 [Coptis chinensis]